MTKENFTSINVIIDRSGSMQPLTNETIISFNKFVEEQKQAPGEAIFTLSLFNTQVELIHNCCPIAEVPALTEKVYNADGFTAYLDAIGATINQVGTKLASMVEEERPSKVIFLIITDGEENSSKEYVRAQIKEMISHQREKYNWEFVFIGANIDAEEEGKSLGIAAHNSVGYQASAVGTKNLYGSVSSSLRSYRSSKSPGPINFFNQTSDDLPAAPVIIAPLDTNPPDSKDNS